MPARVLVLGAALLTALLLALPASPAGGGGSFLVGFADDLPKTLGAPATQPAVALGSGALRVTLTWDPGQTTPSAAQVDALSRAVGAARGMRLVLSVYADAGSKAPLDAAARDTYCGYVKSVLKAYSSIRDVVLWNEPNKRLFWNPQTNAPALYEALLARCYDVLHAAFSPVNVIGLALSSTGNDDAVSTSPGMFIRGVGDAYRASGRTRRVLDTVGFHPYPLSASERPWRKHIQSKVIGEGDWNKLAYNLWLAFEGTAQPSDAPIWYLEIGFQTAVDPSKSALYSGTENVATIPDDAGGEPDAPPPAETSAAPDQSTQVLDSMRLAYCQPRVAAYFNFLLVDEPRLAGWQSGAYWADLTPKDSLPAFLSAIAATTTGSVDCTALKGGLPSPDFMPPSAPGGLAAQVTPAPLSVTLTWNASTDDASPVVYRVYRNAALVATVDATGWTDTAVQPGATYAYSVRALDSAGNLGDASTSVSVSTDVTPPAPPASLSAQWAGPPSRVELAWPAATDDIGVVSYEVSRDGTVLATAPATSFTDSNVAAGTTYSYSVVAIDGGGNRSAPVTASVTTPADGAAPSVPQGLTAKAVTGPRRVKLAWQPSTDDVGVTGYRVFRDGAPIATTGSTKYTDAAVKAATKYRYSVSAFDAAGNESAPSAAVVVKTT